MSTRALCMASWVASPKVGGAQTDPAIVGLILDRSGNDTDRAREMCERMLRVLDDIDSEERADTQRPKAIGGVR